jgi:hypothetical protein
MTPAQRFNSSGERKERTPLRRFFRQQRKRRIAHDVRNPIHTVARQMLAQHGQAAIAKAAREAVACESKARMRTPGSGATSKRP